MLAVELAEHNLMLTYDLLTLLSMLLLLLLLHPALCSARLNIEV
jgi:hypothetical protein